MTTISYLSPTVRIIETSLPKAILSGSPSEGGIESLDYDEWGTSPSQD